MYILGIYHGHNATATLIKNGEVVASVSEERFTGIKNYTGFPEKSIDYCLQEAGIKSNDLDLIVRSTTIGSPFHAASDFRKDSAVNSLHYLHKLINPARKVWGEISYRIPFLRIVSDTSYTVAARTVGYIEIEREKETIARKLAIPKSKVKVYDHHDCHAFSAYYASPFSRERSLVFVLDGEGDNCSATVYIFDKGNFYQLARTPRGVSLGGVYAEVTEFLGMKSNEHEYKVMGLAPYAKKDDIEKTYQIIKGIIFLDKKNPLVFKSKFSTLDTGKFLNHKMRKIRFDILAGAFQKLTEERIVEWVNNAITKTKISTIVLSGGVFMNVKANQKIIQQTNVKKIFVMPSCGDESTPLGACFYALVKDFGYDTKKIKPIKDIYWGPKFLEEQVEEALKKGKIRQKYRVEKVKDIEKETAKLLAKGKIVARLKGRMEFGARALGNRSILANPSDTDTVRIINEQVKNRDFWMPFAPSILQERISDYVINPTNLESHYMMLAFGSTSLARQELKAAIHPYDFTLRPQILSKDYNFDYYRLIKEFERLTGIGAVLNTSFNLHGFPIVLGPKEALDAFENSGLEYLTLENYLISKRST